MIYHTPGGFRTRVTTNADDPTAKDFEEYTFEPEKVVHATYMLPADEAAEKVAELRVLDAVRFGLQYGAGPDAIG